MENETKQQKDIVNKDLGERMKEYESQSLHITKIEPYRSFLVRLDGRSFSKFTGGMQKPFDKNFTKAMLLTTTDLINEFTATTGYTHSDEITIIFKAMATKEETEAGTNKAQHLFDGRVIKILTCMSGYCSVRFNFHLCKLINEKTSDYKSEYVDKINEMKASFDARLVVFPEDKEIEIVNHMIWRSIFDCERNAVSTYARFYFSQKELDSKGKEDMITMMKVKNLNWCTDVPMYLKHGVYLKKVTYEIDYNGEKAIRKKVVQKCLKIKCNEFYFNMLLGKYYEGVEEDEKLYEIETLEINNL
jgi:tRNA(His) guanylyltransferase